MAVTLSGHVGTWTLPEGVSVLGRGTSCEVRIDDPRLSRRHASFEVQADRVVVHDLGSTNGVLVDQERIVRSKALRDGAIVVCGPAALTVRIDDAASPRHLLGASSAEFKPGSAAARTDAMDPVAVHEAGRALTARRINPGIVAALSGSHPAAEPFGAADPEAPTRASLVSSSAIQSSGAPDAPSAPRTQPHASTTLLPMPAPPAASALTEGKLHALHAPVASAHPPTVLLDPGSGVARQSAALAPQAQAERLPARGRRVLAGVLDLGQTEFLAGVLVLLFVLGGYLLACQRAGVVLVHGLPRLPGAQTAAAASTGELLGSLMQPGGLPAAGELLAALRRDPTHRTAFALCFSAMSFACFAWLVVQLLLLVASTALRGAPYWHRRFGLVILHRHQGCYLSWPRACLRFALAVLLWPAALLAIAISVRAPHDVLSGTCVRRR